VAFFFFFLLLYPSSLERQSDPTRGLLIFFTSSRGWCTNVHFSSCSAGPLSLLPSLPAWDDGRTRPPSSSGRRFAPLFLLYCLSRTLFDVPLFTATGRRECACPLFSEQEDQALFPSPRRHSLLRRRPPPGPLFFHLRKSSMKSSPVFCVRP